MIFTNGTPKIDLIFFPCIVSETTDHISDRFGYVTKGCQANLILLWVGPVQILD